ncbi:MAG: hypothetical protein KDB02_03555 [Acidimicrobiales bacterium]|nr:hypothetical protein [Acidimicrobiales bacterium]
MIALVNVLGSMSWDPGFRGFLTVVLAVGILCGSIALILGTNSGARLGTLLAVSALFGWLTVMGIIWSIYGIGWKGQAPTWDVRDIVQSNPANPTMDSEVKKANSLPVPGDGTLPDPVKVREASALLQKEFPPERKTPTLSELAAVDPTLEKTVDAKLDGWKLLSTSNGYSGESQAKVAEEVVAEGLFKDATEFTFLDGYWTGGEKPRKDDSTIGRIIFKVTNTFDRPHPPFYVAIQLQAVVPQEAKPGQAPPTVVRDKDATVYTVIMERNRGNLRQPAIFFTIFSAIMFGVTTNMLHRRDKLAQLQRAAVAGAA